MITVCMAVFNGEKYIRQQMESILCQIGPGDEVVMSDDGSTDHTVDIVKEMCDPRVRIIEGPRKHSATCNFAHAISMARGEYIFLSDQDDVWLPDKVAVMMKHLEKHACVVSDCYVTDESLNVTSASFMTLIGRKTSRLYNLLIHNAYSGSCMAFRREVAQLAMPFPARVAMHDLWIGNVAAFFFDVMFIPDRLIYFRRHSGTTSTAAGKSDKSLPRKIADRIYTVKCLAELWIREKTK